MIITTLTEIYLAKNKQDRFYFSVISWVLRNQTYDTSIFIAVKYVHHMHLFSAQETLQNSLHATYTFLHVLHVCSCALVVLLANCYVDILH